MNPPQMEPIRSWLRCRLIKDIVDLIITYLEYNPSEIIPDLIFRFYTDVIKSTRYTWSDIRTVEINLHDFYQDYVKKPITPLTFRQHHARLIFLLRLGAETIHVPHYIMHSLYRGETTYLETTTFNQALHRGFHALVYYCRINPERNRKRPFILTL